MALRRISIALALALFFACGEETREAATELIVVVDSDLAVPDELDRIEIETRGPAGRSQTAHAELGEGEAALPRSLALRHLGGSLGPIFIQVRGELAGQIVVTREAETSFVNGRSLVVPLHLVRGCAEVSCDEGQTCTEAGCRAIAQEALRAWTGDKPRLSSLDGGQDEPGVSDAEIGGDEQVVLDPDAGVDGMVVEADAQLADGAAGPEAGQCVPREELCNALDDDCDGVIDNGFDFNRDSVHCGGCGNVCNERRGDFCCRGVCARSCL